jgi:hypothetical protein
MKGILVAVLLISMACLPARSQKADSVAPETVARDQYVSMTRRAVASLKTDLDKFRLSLKYHGLEKDKYSLHLSVEPSPDDLSATYLRARISREQAVMIIGHLAGDGFLYRGTINSMKQLVRPKERYYFLEVRGAQADSYFEFIPSTAQPYRWHGMERPPILEQMKALRAVLTGDAGEMMDRLVKALEVQQAGP